MKVAVIGTGRLGQRHLEKWFEMPGVEIVGIVGRSETELTDLSAMYQTSTYADMASLLCEQAVDLLDICTPTHTHSAFIIAAAGAGVDLICEKPIARTFAEAKAAIQACQAAGVSLYIAHTLAFFPVYAAVKDYLQAEPREQQLTIQMARGVPYPGATRAWYVDETKSGGLFLDLGVHEFEWLISICGDVQAVSTAGVRRNEAGTVIYGVVKLEFVRGATAFIELSWDEPAFRASFAVTLADGQITYDHTGDRPVFTPSPGEEPRNPFAVLSTEDPYVRQLRHFMACQAGEVAPLLSTADAAKAVQVAELARLSVTAGKQSVK